MIKIKNIKLQRYKKLSSWHFYLFIKVALYTHKKKKHLLLFIVSRKSRHLTLYICCARSLLPLLLLIYFSCRHCSCARGEGPRPASDHTRSFTTCSTASDSHTSLLILLFYPQSKIRDTTIFSLKKRKIFFTHFIVYINNRFSLKKKLKSFDLIPKITRKRSSYTLYIQRSKVSNIDRDTCWVATPPPPSTPFTTPKNSKITLIKIKLYNTNSTHKTPFFPPPLQKI